MSKGRPLAAGRVIVCRLDRCLACRSCELACAVVHSRSRELAAAVAETPRPQARVHVEPLPSQPQVEASAAGPAAGRALAIQCRHCEQAPCIAVCPTGAMHRESDEAPVLIDAARCIGCKMCIVACPFGVIAVSADGKAVVKCDLCGERLAAGEPPACVAACPTGALEFVSAEELGRRKRRAAAAAAARGAEEADPDAQ